MKKLLALILATVTMVSVATAEGDVGVQINVHPLGYMNHAVITWYDLTPLKGQLDAQISAIFGEDWEVSLGTQKGTDVYNMYALGLDVTYEYLYASISFGIPTSAPSSSGFSIFELDKKWEAFLDPKITGSVLMDLQLGGGVSLLKDLPVNLFIGGGLSLNCLHIKQPVLKEKYQTNFDVNDPTAIKSLDFVRDYWSMGLGVRISADYMFIKNVGVSLTITDSILPIRLSSKARAKGKTSQNIDFDAKPKDDVGSAAFSEDKEVAKTRLTNNFALRAGVEFKF